MEIGEKIKEFRLKRGLTQTELGEKLGIVKSAVCQVERGAEANLTIDRVRAFADALGCSIYDLIDEKPTASEGKQTDFVEFMCAGSRITFARNRISGVIEDGDSCRVFLCGNFRFFINEPYDEVIRKIKGGE